MVFNTGVTLYGAAALHARRPRLHIEGAQKDFWDGTLWFLACLVHRLRPADPVTDSSTRGEMAAALNRAVGRGTEIAVGEKPYDRVFVPAMDPDLIGAWEMNLRLASWRGKRLRVRFANGGVREVPWLVGRGAERRQVHRSFETSDKLRPLGRRCAQRRRTAVAPLTVRQA